MKCAVNRNLNTLTRRTILPFLDVTSAFKILPRENDPGSLQRFAAPNNVAKLKYYEVLLKHMLEVTCETSLINEFLEKT
jgi:hypothetical protein